MAHRPYYLQIVRGSLGRIDRYLRAQLALIDGMARAERSIWRSLKACIEGEAEKAHTPTRDHVLNARHALLDFLKERHGAAAQ